MITNDMLGYEIRMTSYEIVQYEIECLDSPEQNKLNIGDRVCVTGHIYYYNDSKGQHVNNKCGYINQLLPPLHNTSMYNILFDDQTVGVEINEKLIISNHLSDLQIGDTVVTLDFAKYDRSFSAPPNSVGTIKSIRQRYSNTINAYYLYTLYIPGYKDCEYENKYIKKLSSPKINLGNTYYSRNPLYSQFTFKLRSCIADQNGFYYVTIFKNKDIIPDNLIGRELKITLHELDKYDIYYGPNGQWSSNDGMYDSVNPKYSGYKFMIKTFNPDPYGYYYLTILKKNDFIFYNLNQNNIIKNNNFILNKNPENHICSICHEKVINLCSKCLSSNSYSGDIVLDPLECGIFIGKCGHVYHRHCKELFTIVNQNNNCLECNKIFKKYVFIKPVIDSQLNSLTNKNYLKYIKYIKHNEKQKVNKIAELSEKVNKTTWIKKLKNNI
jgi:hypothetical protein